MNAIYSFLYTLCRIGFFVWHPVFRVHGRENVPEGGALICCNHSGMADPLWVIFAMGRKNRMRIMAKVQLIRTPVLGKFLEWVGVFGVDRGNNDINAIKTALRVLKEGQKLLLFPEGTRVKPPKRIPAKSGAALFATRTDSLVVPVYVTPRRAPFVPVDLTFGTPYRMEYEGKKPTPAELQSLSDALMDQIYAMGATK
jgi:1-acyl-sn-glycerol-3-phosphate acyltransferase